MKKNQPQLFYQISALKGVFSKEFICNFSLICIFYLLSTTFSFAQTPVERFGQLKVSGNKIVDANNNPVQLRGMSLFWSQWKPQYYNYQTIKWLRDDWCISVIRIAMGVESGGYLTNPTVEKNKVIAVVDAAIALGIYVIIDFHDHSASEKLSTSQTFFNEMSAKYKDQPNVLYEIWNEPLETDSWKNEIKPYCEAVISTIRKNDPDNIIICGTRSWSQQVNEAADSPIQQPNIAYTLHFYATSHNQWLRNIAKYAIDKGIALFVTEYGTCEASGNGTINTTETQAWYTFLNQYNISHCNWAVSDKAESASALTAGASGSGDWTESQITTSGKIVRTELKSRCPAANISPTVSITTPLNNASYNAPAAVGLAANAIDSDGAISKVDFYNGTDLLFSDVAAPYSYSWTGVTAGTYTITAKATDNAGATTTSSTVTFTVKAGTPPSITIAAPATNSVFTAPATINLTANATDLDGTVTKVEFYNGDKLINTDVSSPFGYGWIDVPAGKYNITAKATDNNGEVTTSTPITVTVNNPENPQISITVPLNNATYVSPASLIISADASDSDGTVAKVDFYNGTNLLGTDLSSPFSYNWSNVTTGSYSITAKATDNSGLTAISAPVTFVVKDATVNAPKVTITAPANNSSFNAPATISFSATATSTDALIKKVDFYNGDQLIGSDATFGYGALWKNVSAGTYIIRAVVTDNQGNTGTSAPVTLIIKPTPKPVVSIQAPTDNSEFLANSDITISANATDEDGTVVKVEFYNGSELLGSDATTPFNFLWKTVQPGNYIITARATDNVGQTTISKAIIVNVRAPQPATIYISSPENNDSFTEPSTISISAVATPGEGSIVKVDFFDGDSLLGTVTSYPYIFAASGLNAGEHVLSARVTSTNGSTATSATVTVMVLAAVRDCNGETGGTAGVDVCGKCSGGNTGIQPNSDPAKCGTVTNFEDKSQLELKFYPNPFNETLTIEFTEVSNFTVTDLSGRTFEQGTKDGASEIGKDLSSGIYLLKIKSESKEFNIKIHKL